MPLVRRADRGLVELLARATVRVLLWLTIALPVACMTLLIIERLMFAGVIGEENAASIWWLIAWLAGAFIAGNAAAYGGDHLLRRLRERSRPLRRPSHAPSA